MQVKKPFKKEITLELPTHSFLIHSNISRKNKNAYYLVTQIEALLVQAGEKAEEVHITFENLISRIPTLQRALENQKTADKNKTLKRAFIKTYELLRKSTDIYLYYKDLQVVETIPTTTTLDKSLVIIHNATII